MKQNRRAVKSASAGMRGTERAIGRLLDKSSLAPLLQRAAELHEASNRLRSRLGTPLGDHCRVANRRGDSLVVEADSAAWGSRLRFLAPQILAALREDQGWSGLSKLKVIVRPAEPEAPPPPCRRLTLSTQSATALVQAADATEDASLGAALRRLSRRTR